jgi:hypothetical protein
MRRLAQLVLLLTLGFLPGLPASTLRYGNDQIAAADLPPGVTTHTDTGLPSATTYTYRLYAVLNGFASDCTDEVSATTVPADTIPKDDLRLWLSAGAEVLTDSEGKVSQWSDRSGMNNHATQGNASNRPAFVVESDNGYLGGPTRRYVSFAATGSQVLNLPDFMSGATEGEVFVLLRINEQKPASPRGLWRMGGESGSLYPDSNEKAKGARGRRRQKGLGGVLLIFC